MPRGRRCETIGAAAVNSARRVPSPPSRLARRREGLHTGAPRRFTRLGGFAGDTNHACPRPVGGTGRHTSRKEQTPVRRWLWPALLAAAVAAALGAATLATARASDGRHGDRNRTEQKSTASTESTSSSSSSSDSTVCGEDVTWLQTSISGDRFEIDGGKIALSKTHNPKVIELAQTLIKDHTQSLQSAIELAAKLGIDVPSEPTPSMQWELEEVGELSGTAFDHDYSELEVQDHIQDIQETTDEVKMGCNDEVRDEASKDIPMLQYHLQLAQEALASAANES